MGTVILLTMTWLFKLGAYWIVFRRRTIKASVMDCLIIAGAPLLVSAISMGLPSFLFILLSIGLAVYLTMHYTGVSLIPDGLFIPLTIEIVFRVAQWGIIESGILS